MPEGLRDQAAARRSGPPDDSDGRTDAAWFGEAASRVVIACGPEVVPELERRAASVQLPFARLGLVGGDVIALGHVARVPLAVARNRYDEALENLS